MHRVGDQWDCGELNVYQERHGCELISRLLVEFRRIIPEPPSNAPLAIGGTPEGDYYGMSTQLVELVLRSCNWRTINLGTNLPLESVAAAIGEHKPRMVWLSVSHLTDQEEFIEQFGELQSAIPPDTLVVLGGRALTDDIRPKLKYTGYCDNMQHLESFVQALHVD